MVKTRGLESAKAIVKKVKVNASTDSKRNRVAESANAKAATGASGRKKRAYRLLEEEESPSPVVSMQKKKPGISEAEEPKAKRSRKEPSKSVGGISGLL